MRTRPVTPARRRRPAFTLIELLVVISIIATLAGLSAGAFFRVRNAQLGKTTDATISKLNTTIERKWSATLDAAAEDARLNRIPSQVLTYAGNDKDRARTLWTYMKVRSEFPTTFAEARAGVTVNGFTLPSPTAFTSAFPGAVTGTKTDESAACLYAIVTLTAARGEGGGLDGVNQQVGDVDVGGNKYKAFFDAWGKPIAFARFAQSTELNDPAYRPAGATNKDPFDPLGKMQASGAWTAATANSFWSLLNANHLPDCGLTPATYSNENRSWTLISFGANKKPGAPLVGNAGDALDNVLGFRLRREGNRGN